jgi:putative N6-adenine-specific DNA methylase
VPQFFLSCNLGLESILEQELKEVFPYLVGKDGRPQTSGYKVLALEKGGVEIETDLELGLQLNLFLKTCGRILLRLGSEKMVEFYHLEAWLKKIRPQHLLSQKSFQFEISASHSKLGHEKRLAQTMEKVFGPAAEAGPTLFLRLFEDRAQFSVDTSGLHLHFRGYRQQQGLAPLRETLAAALLLEFIKGFSVSQIAQINLCDPFCGSGTLLIEAERLYSPENLRHYDFQSWPQLPALLKSESFVSNLRGFSELRWKSLNGSDIDSEVISKARANAQRAQSEGIEWKVADALSAEVQFPSKTWLISNPPYGERVQGVGRDGVALLKKIMEIQKPERAGFLVPESWSFNCEGYKSKRALSFKNGGLPVQFLIFET